MLAKKSAGYLSVTLLPAASSPPALVVNENVAAAPVLPATLSEAEIENDVWLTWPPITPELTLEEAKASFEVLTLTAVELAVAAPMVKPLIVTVLISATQAGRVTVTVHWHFVVGFQVPADGPSARAQLPVGARSRVPGGPCRQ